MKIEIRQYPRHQQFISKMKFSPDELVNQKEAAEIRGVSPQSINDLVKRGKLKTIIISNQKFLLRSEVENFKPGKGGRPRTRPDKKPTKRRSRKSK